MLQFVWKSSLNFHSRTAHKNDQATPEEEIRESSRTTATVPPKLELKQELVFCDIHGLTSPCTIAGTSEEPAVPPNQFPEAPSLDGSFETSAAVETFDLLGSWSDDFGFLPCWGQPDLPETSTWKNINLDIEIDNYMFSSIVDQSSVKE